MISWFWRRKKKRVAPPLRLPDVVIVRGPSTDHGTFGFLNARGLFKCVTCEPPDYGNEPNYSRIPPGIYVCTPYSSARFPKAFLVTGVDGRSYILTHSGNLGGDRKKGFRSHTLGCIILGKYFGKLSGQKAVMCSKLTVRKFIDFMGYKEFVLEIREVV